MNGGRLDIPGVDWDEVGPELLEVLEAMVAAECEYMTINNLGDPEQQHNIKWARSVIAKAVPK